MKRSKQGLGAVLLCAAAGGAAAQNNAVLVDPGQKTVRVVRTTARPVIDGDLSDAVWAAAAVVDYLQSLGKKPAKAKAPASGDGATVKAKPEAKRPRAAVARR